MESAIESVASVWQARVVRPEACAAARAAPRQREEKHEGIELVENEHAFSLRLKVIFRTEVSKFTEPPIGPEAQPPYQKKEHDAVEDQIESLNPPILRIVIRNGDRLDAYLGE